jgi:hypothetical protein
MPQAGVEPTIPMFELAKTADALDRAVTVIGRKSHSHTPSLYALPAKNISRIKINLTETTFCFTEGVNYV